jgi:hypothetical protein
MPSRRLTGCRCYKSEPRPILLSIGLRADPPQCIVLSLWVTGATFVHQRLGCSLNSRAQACGISIAGRTPTLTR